MFVRGVGGLVANCAPACARRARAVAIALLLVAAALWVLTGRAAGSELVRAASASAIRTPAGAARASRPALAQGGTSLASLIRRQHMQSGVALAPSATSPYWACPESFCDAIIDPRAQRSAHDGTRYVLPDGGPALEGGGEDGGIDPEELRAAYDIPATGGEGQTVALIEAYSYKDAEPDLATYRSRYGLPPCTKKKGCFVHINQQGGKPKNREVSVGWETETALDLDMVSAACPQCHILLVDAERGSLRELGEAVDTAVARGAQEISNSYGLPDEECNEECLAAIPDYEHRGTMIMASAGDYGYDDYQEGADSPNFPAALPSVVAVGGTALRKAADERGWSEEVWSEASRGIGTGSGCASAAMGAKPDWQTDLGCVGRSDNDTAAVAACQTPVSSYSSAEGGWRNVCGTSVSSPLLAGIEAHASAFARLLPGADAFYHDPAASFDVTAGSNGVCSIPAGYEDLCNAGVGWDGPTGNGTPHGPLTLTGAPPDAVTAVPTGVEASAATFNGSVEAGGLATAYRFEYGTSTNYGSSAPAGEGSAGSGTEAVAVSATVGELQPETVYHYRLVATNSEGTAYGRDQEFDTGLPRVTGVSPGGGGRAGYRTAQITGANFVHVTGVAFGSERASYTVESPSSISVEVPTGEREGAVSVTVTTLAGTSIAGPGARYTYELGDMLAWGHDAGDLGRGFFGSLSYAPIEVAGELPEVTQLAANSESSTALLADGEVLTWGEGKHGTLGDGNSKASATPVRVCAVGVHECAGGPYLQDVSQIASGYNFTLALLSNGTVVGWGRDWDGQLSGGVGIGGTVPVPVAVCTIVEAPCSPEHQLQGVVQIAAGHETSYALLEDGTVFAWGKNGYEGALGDGKAEPEEFSQVPVQVSDLSGVTSIAADGWGGLAVVAGGAVEAWGDNEAGQLGDDSSAEASDLPVAVCSGTGKHGCGSSLSEVRAVYGAARTSYALLQNGSVLAWGSNSTEGLGDPTAPTQTCRIGVESTRVQCVLTPVKADLGEVDRLATGQGLSDVLALLDDGELVAWGSGIQGDLGAGGEEPVDGVAVPMAVCAPYASAACPSGPYLSGEVLAMAAGDEHDLVYARR